MRLLIDQDVYAITARFLENLGHDVLRVSAIGLATAPDEELLKVAQQQSRLFLTRDRDFGGLVFVKRIIAGVLYIRVLPSTVHALHTTLQQVLNTHTEQELRESFVVIEPGTYRIRRLPTP